MKAVLLAGLERARRHSAFAAPQLRRDRSSGAAARERRGQGRIGDKPWSKSIDLAQAADGAGIARLWARRKVDETEIASQLGTLDGEQAEARIARLGLGFGLVTSETSLVAVDRTPSRPRGARLTEEELPLNLPKGWNFAVLFNGAGDLAPAADPSTGQSAAALDLPVAIAETPEGTALGACLLGRHALGELPDFKALPGTTVGPQHRGTIHITPTMEYIERAYDAAKYGRPSEAPPFDPDDPDFDIRAAPGETTAEIVEFYGKARAAADQAIEEIGLEETGTSWAGDTVSMRWVLIHMIEETARHNGHADILRESIDGTTGE